MHHLGAVAISLIMGLALASSEPIGQLFGPVPVERVLDGDTVVLESDLGPRTVRLIGIDAPETSHPERRRELLGPEARAFTEELLPAGTPVWVELDVQIEDAYGHLLAYVYIEDGTGEWSIGDSSASMVNLMLAESGYARVLIIEPNSAYADLFERAVRTAQVQGLALWDVDVAASADGSDPAGASGSALPPGAIVIACTLYDPPTDFDLNAETVTLLLRETIDTRGYYLHDEESGKRLYLPPGEHGPGELDVLNPDQGIWNNSGDTIYLKRGQEIVDQWDYTDQRPGSGEVICRDDP